MSLNIGRKGQGSAMQSPHRYMNTPGLIFVIVAALIFSAVLAWQVRYQNAPGIQLKKKVLLLHPRSMDSPFYASFTDGLKQTLEAETGYKAEYCYEYWEMLSYVPDAPTARSIAQVLRRKYQAARPDIIVAHSPASASFLQNYCGDIFGDTPVIVFETRPFNPDSAGLPANYTLCYPLLDPAQNVKLILRLDPSVRQLYVILGHSATEEEVRDNLPHLLAPFAGRLAINYIDVATLPELLECVRTIGGPAAVLFVDYVQDAQKNLLVPARVLRTIAALSPVPVYGSYSTHVGDGGAVGGYVVDTGAFGREVGREAAAILKGAPPLGGTAGLNISAYMFDWKDLKRWHIDENRLPVGSIILEKPLSVFQEYRWHISAAIVFMLLQAALIAFYRKKGLRAEMKKALGDKIIAEKVAIIRESEERFRTVFDNSPAMIAILRMVDNRFVEVNEKYLKVLDYAREEVIGHTPKDLNIFVDLTDDYLHEWLTELRSKDELPVTEYKLRTKSGKIITVLATFTLSHVGNDLCRIAIMQDITEQRRLEADLLRLDRLNLVGEMAAGIGHEVRNPMTTVRGYLQMFQRKDKFGEYQEQLATMIQELDRANTIISEFLSLAKNKASDLQSGNINASLIALYPLLEAKAARTGHIIDLRTEMIPEIRFDDKELRQLVLNLAHNSFEAMPAGGTLAITTYREPNAVVLEVRDTGSGIPASIVKKIGTPFLTTKENGTGLGLSVCYRIAQRHNAKIEFTTGKKGTTFYVRFPLEG